MTRRTTVFVALLAVVLISAVAYAAVTTLDDGDEKAAPDPAPAAEGVPEGLEKFYSQEVSWDDCGDARCARVEVPVDYEEPDGETLELAVKVIEAKGDGGRSLFINPGGPGGDAHQFADYMKTQFGERVLDAYDIVAVDPRGVGKSTPIDCLSDRELDAWAAGEPTPDDDAEVQEFRRAVVEFGEGCERRSGAVAAHVSTEEAARDFDVVRALVGADELDWFGASYGTKLGATYAALFPKTVGRMVLDGAVNPSLSAEESAMAQTTGFQRALEAYLDDCTEQDACPLGNDPDAAEQRLVDFFDARDAAPLDTGQKRKLTQGLAFYGIAVTLYDEQTWPVLSTALDAALDGDGSVLLRLADAYLRRAPDGSYFANLQEANPTINCLDVEESSTVEQVEASLPRFERASQLFGPALAWGALACTEWPIEATHPQQSVDATGSDPILVIGTTRDPATPYESAVALTQQLKTGVLLTREGDGHTAYTSGNRCIQEQVDDFLVDGTVPDKGTRCEE